MKSELWRPLCCFNTIWLFVKLRMLPCDDATLRVFRLREDMSHGYLDISSLRHAVAAQSVVWMDVSCTNIPAIPILFLSLPGWMCDDSRRIHSRRVTGKALTFLDVYILLSRHLLFL